MEGFRPWPGRGVGGLPEGFLSGSVEPPAASMGGVGASLPNMFSRLSVLSPKRSRFRRRIPSRPASRLLVSHNMALSTRPKSTRSSAVSEFVSSRRDSSSLSALLILIVDGSSMAESSPQDPANMILVLRNATALFELLPIRSHQGFSGIPIPQKHRKLTRKELRRLWAILACLFGPV